MFRRASKSSSGAGPALEHWPHNDVCDKAGPQDEHLKQWRDAAQRVARTYYAWCAAGRRDRHDLYLSFLDALRREEQAARQVELDALGLGAADPAS